MPLDSGYVLIQPCVACWREPTAMSRLLRVSWLSAGRHSIPEKGTWTFRMDEAATGEQTGETASQRARHLGTQRTAAEASYSARGSPSAKQSSPSSAPGSHGAPAPRRASTRGARGRCGAASPAPRGVRSHWDIRCGCRSPVPRQAACVRPLWRPWGPSCCRQGPDHGDAPTALMLESLLTGLRCWAARDCAWPLVAHQPQPRVG